MHVGKKSSSDSKKHPTGSFMGRLKERKIIATLAAFIGGGWLMYEVVHWIFVDHYHLPEMLKDITIVTFLGALLSTVIWKWFRGAEKRPGNVKVEVLVVPLIVLLTLVIDLKFIFVMTGVSINMLLIGIIALCLGIAWVVFKSLQWAASTPGAEKKNEVLKPVEEKSISFPETKCSLVVLPFVDMSPDRNNEYFSDGLTEEIITDLSQVHELCVISRNSAMTLKGTKKDTKTIGKELNVQYILEGSVRKVENDLRITAQLIDAEMDIHLWAEKYSGTMDDIFDIQENVSRSIVDALKIKLTPEESKKIAERPIDNIQAYECYLRARRELFGGTADGLERALRELEIGLDILGQNVLLYQGIAEVYLQYYEYGIRADEETLQKAEEFANKVIKSRPGTAEGHYLLGRIERFRGTVIKAAKHFKKAVAINPDHTSALLFLCGALGLQIGKASLADPLIKRLMETDPLTPLTMFCIGYIQWLEGQLDHALSTFQKVIKLEPDNVYVNLYCVYVLAWQKKYDQAFNLIDQVIQKGSPAIPFTEWCLFLKYALKGEKAKALGSLSEEVKSYFWNDPESPWLGASTFALIDEKGESLKWLEHAINRGWINYPLFAEKDPFLENIRSEPRFKKLMEKVKHEWEDFEV